MKFKYTYQQWIHNTHLQNLILQFDEEMKCQQKQYES